MSINKTISGQISNGKAIEISDKQLRLESIIDLGGDRIILNTNSILSKYKTLLNKYINTYKFSAGEANKYEYKPTMLSYDLYGTIELAPFILQINHMISAIEFTNLDVGIKLFNNNIREFLNEIINKEEKSIKMNRNEIKNSSY